MKKIIIWEGPAKNWPLAEEFKNYEVIVRAFDPEEWIKLEKKDNKCSLNCNSASNSS